ncbi:hypothetical protein [uncultured Cetobacterium sp.]|uniref:hypothetical protein n=1 Tax=uncultured Cetobacterium sp. TaxID=527638 RepID=UPI00262AB38F|nr:hypothetical protein [uncultured Cetobacterium sp.]
MKKLLLLGLLIGNLTYANHIGISQNFLKTQLTDSLKNSTTFEKFKPILAREGVIGEVIKTYTKDGLETTNTVTEASYIVKNTTEAKEEYIIPKSKFEKRYKFIKNKNKKWDIFQPIGEIKAVKVKNKDTFFIIAPWGEEMIVKNGDFLVSPLDYSEIYRIANKEFFETYQEKK